MASIRVQVVGLEKVEGVSRKTGQPYSIRRAHAVCQIDGQAVVAKLEVPRELPDVVPGVYDVQPVPYVDREGNLGFRIGAYHAVDGGRKAA